MLSSSIKITLLQHPTVALKVGGFEKGEFEDFSDSGVYLGNVYRRIIPASLCRLASLMERYLPASVDILDLRVMDPDREEVYKTLDWEGYAVEARRVGGSFSRADQAITNSDWIGLSSHFTFESGVVRDLIAHARKVKPSIKILVGGADVSARPQDYLAFGADIAFVGDFDASALTEEQTEPRIVGPHRQSFEDLIDPSIGKLEHLMEYRDSHDGKVPDGVPFPIGFVYFTRGCPRECDFCESRKTKYEVLELEQATEMLQHYQTAGIKTLNLSDDNLLLQAANPHGRLRLLALLSTMREMGFAWEFPNGLEVGRLLKNDQLDEELMEALFSHSVDERTGAITGAYRLYVPVETFDQRDHYRKLKPIQDQQRIISGLARSGLPEIDFGVVLPPHADKDTFRHTKEGYEQIKNIMSTQGDTKARYAVFHLIPIAQFRSMKTKYSVAEFPEGWNFYFPVYDGSTFSARQLFEERLRLIREIDYQNYLSLPQGRYDYA
ncbi:MAG TPA: cobalamin-dependent protein [Pyrinomonadaceae bacterium]|nr:cobalamin-dependent protein [Pyrinomonadaceae bacterium]